jgi:hypothetical protein
MSANDTQVGGDHYQSKEAAVGICPKCYGPIQHWDWAQSLKGLEYAATKYLGRWHLKDGLKSLMKVMHYTQKIIETHFPHVKVKLEFEYKTPFIDRVKVHELKIVCGNCEREYSTQPGCCDYPRPREERDCGICSKPESECDCAATGRR